MDRSNVPIILTLLTHLITVPVTRPFVPIVFLYPMGQPPTLVDTIVRFIISAIRDRSVTC